MSDLITETFLETVRDFLRDARERGTEAECRRWMGRELRRLEELYRRVGLNDIAEAAAYVRVIYSLDRDYS